PSTSYSPYRWSAYGTPFQIWTGNVDPNRLAGNFWRGGGPVGDTRDGMDRVAPVPLVYANTGQEEHLWGETEQVRWSASNRVYPDFCRAPDGSCWVWTTTGLLLPWEDVTSPGTP